MKQVALALPIILAACVTTPQQQASIIKTVTVTCKGIEATHVSFSTLALNNVVKGSIIAKEQAAYAGAHILCADPAALTDPATALVQLTNAAVTIAIALRDAS